MAVSTEIPKLYRHYLEDTSLNKACPIDDVVIVTVTKVVMCPDKENNWHMLVYVSCYYQVR